MRKSDFIVTSAAVTSVATLPAYADCFSVVACPLRADTAHAVPEVATSSTAVHFRLVAMSNLGPIADASTMFVTPSKVPMVRQSVAEFKQRSAVPMNASVFSMLVEPSGAVCELLRVVVSKAAPTPPMPEKRPTPIPCVTYLSATVAKASNTGAKPLYVMSRHPSNASTAGGPASAATTVVTVVTGAAPVPWATSSVAASIMADADCVQYFVCVQTGHTIVYLLVSTGDACDGFTVLYGT